MYKISGKAKIKFKGVSGKEYLFSVYQEMNGRINGVIDVKDYFPNIGQFPSIEEFYGTTESAFNISVVGAVIKSMSINSSKKNQLYFYAEELKLFKDRIKFSEIKIKFILTNFLFSGDETYLSRVTRDKKYYKRQLVVKLSDKTIIFRPVFNYKKIIKSLMANRKPFRSSLKELHRTLGIKPNNKQIDLVITIRNSLVHSLSFENDIKKSSYEKYCILLALNDRIILALLNYHGSYYNWQKQEIQDMLYFDDQTIK